MAIKKKSGLDNLLVQKTEVIDINELTTHHKNARRGDIGLIAESLEHNGQYRPILVNVGTKTGRGNEIAAGNHTYLAARRLGWGKIYASFIDVDEKTLTRILLADNKTAEAGDYDTDALSQLLAELGTDDVLGTGYKPEEAEALLEGLANMEAPKINLDDLTSLMPEEEDEDGLPTKRPRITVNEDDADEADFQRGLITQDDDADDDLDDLDTDGGVSLEQAQIELQLILESKEDNLWLGDNFWQIPDLREDMLVTDLPDSIKTWAGHQASPDDGVSHYVYNYSLGGTKGLPFDRTILAFNTHDNKFIGWWNNPAYYTAKLMTEGLRMAVCPDFSFYYTQSRMTHLQGVHNSQWLGRFFQEAGMKVIPRVQYDDEDSFEFNMLGIPKNPPYIEISAQNKRDDWGDKDTQEKIHARLIQKAIDHLEPTKGIILYGGPPAERILDRLDSRGVDKIHWENYAAVRRGTVFDKKEAGASLTAKQKDELRERLIKEGKIKKRTKANEADIFGDEEFETALHEDEMADK